MNGIATLDSSAVASKVWTRQKRHAAFDLAFDAAVQGLTLEADTHLLRAGFTPEERREVIEIIAARERRHD